MSTYEEELRSLRYARKFMGDLRDRALFPRVPKKIRLAADKLALDMHVFDNPAKNCRPRQQEVLVNLRNFLWSLDTPRDTPRVPTNVRALAHTLSRHLPLVVDRAYPLTAGPISASLYTGGVI